MVVTLHFTDDGWICELVDIEAAFLEGYNKGLQFMEWPPGLLELGFATKEQIKLTCLQMLRCIYGNVEAALRFYTTYAQYLIKELGMTRSLTDSCLFFMKDESGKVVLMASRHVDDTQIAGRPEWIKFFKDKVKERFNIKELVRLQKHLGIKND